MISDQFSEENFKSMEREVRGQPVDSGFSMHAVRRQPDGSPAVPTEGYMVSRPSPTAEISTPDISSGDIRHFAVGAGSALGADHTYLGGWNSPAGHTALDISDNIRPRQDLIRGFGQSTADEDAAMTAMETGKRNNQEAIWDVKNMTSIPNPDYKAKE